MLFVVIFISVIYFFSFSVFVSILAIGSSTTRLRLLIRRVCHDPGCRSTVCEPSPVITKLFKWNVCAGHYIIGPGLLHFFLVFLLPLILFSIFLFFSFFCVLIAHKKCGNFVCRKLENLWKLLWQRISFPSFIHFRLWMAIAKICSKQLLHIHLVPASVPSRIIIWLFFRYPHPLRAI